MAEEKQQTPFGEMVSLWQKMVWEGFEMMLKTPRLRRRSGEGLRARGV